MGRKKKSELEKLNSGEPSNDEVQPVEEEIETNEQAESISFGDRLKDKLKEITSNEDGAGLKPFDELSPGGKWARLHKKGRKPKEQENLQEDFSTLVTSLLVVVVTAWNAPEQIKPNNDELGGLSFRITRITLRHIDLSGKVTADVLDLIGIIAIGASYYSRVAPQLKQLQQPREAQIDRQAFYRDNGNVPGSDEPWVTPIQQADPGLKNWLDDQADNERGLE